jgi:hypothetical protein
MAHRTWEYVIASEPLRYAFDADLGMTVCVSRPAYAECQGLSDPFCGRCRFSVHGCNANSPSRAEYLADLEH